MYNNTILYDVMLHEKYVAIIVFIKHICEYEYTVDVSTTKYKSSICVKPSISPLSWLG